MEKLGLQVESIGDIMTAIFGIADQTNLLLGPVSQEVLK